VDTVVVAVSYVLDVPDILDLVVVVVASDMLHDSAAILELLDVDVCISCTLELADVIVVSTAAAVSDTSDITFSIAV
jgi:hypothetical protein